MSDWIGLFGNYETVGKKINPNKTFDLHKERVETEGIYAQRAVIQFNSTFVELIDRWNYWRGFIAFIAIIIFTMCFGMSLFIGIESYNDYSKTSLGGNIFLTIIVITLFLTGVAFLHFFRRECFSYTHYPIRFNRKLRKVYVIQPNKTLLVANWKDVHIGLQRGGRSLWDVRFSLLDDEGKVTDTFALPFTDLSPDDPELLGHWEFIRRYMQGKPPQASYDALSEVFPIHKRKESMAESFDRVMLHASAAYEQPVDRMARLMFWSLFPIRLMQLIGRILSIKTSRIPHFPDWVEQECAIDPNDPYDFEQHPKPKPESEPIGTFEYLIYVVLFFISIVLFLGFIDLLSMAKGHDTGLVRGLFSWM